MQQKNNKPILAIETSSDVCGAAIFYNTEKYSEINLKLKNVHSEKLMEIIQQQLEINKIELMDLSSIAVSAGPGSFTGLRIGMSAAKGLAFGAGLPIISVPTFEAFALQVSGYMHTGSEFIIVTKVNVDEVYYARFLNKDETYLMIDDLQVIPKEQLKFKITNNILVFGNVINENYTVNNRIISAPNASSIGKWAYLFGKDLLNYNFDFLEPNYLKNFVVKTKGE